MGYTNTFWFWFTAFFFKHLANQLLLRMHNQSLTNIAPKKWWFEDEDDPFLLGL